MNHRRIMPPSSVIVFLVLLLCVCPNLGQIFDFEDGLLPTGWRQSSCRNAEGINAWQVIDGDSLGSSFPKPSSGQKYYLRMIDNVDNCILHTNMEQFTGTTEVIVTALLYGVLDVPTLEVTVLFNGTRIGTNITGDTAAGWTSEIMSDVLPAGTHNILEVRF